MNIRPEVFRWDTFDRPVILGSASHRVVEAGESFSPHIVQLASNLVAKDRKLPRPHRALTLSIACISAADFLSRSGSANRLDWRLRSGRRPRYVTLCPCVPIFVRLHVKRWPHFRCHRRISVMARLTVTPVEAHPPLATRCGRGNAQRSRGASSPATCDCRSALTVLGVPACIRPL